MRGFIPVFLPVVVPTEFTISYREGELYYEESFKQLPLPDKPGTRETIALGNLLAKALNFQVEEIEEGFKTRGQISQEGAVRILLAEFLAQASVLGIISLETAFAVQLELLRRAQKSLQYEGEGK